MSIQNTLSQLNTSLSAAGAKLASSFSAQALHADDLESFSYYDQVKISDAFARQRAGVSRLDAALEMYPFEPSSFTEAGEVPLEAKHIWGTMQPRPALKETLAPSSDRAAVEQRRLAQIARQRSANRRPDGRCYNHVWRFLQAVGSYGNVLRAGIPDQYSRYAKQFAQYADKNLEKLGLRKLPIDNPYEAPPGALVVVRPGAPGTGHPVAGDIAVADGNGRFFNGGEMRYGGPQNFPPGNKHVLGIYVPA